MSILGLETVAPETRSGFTELVIDQLIARAEGAVSDAARTSALETCASFVARCFAAAEVNVTDAWKPALGASTRATIGRRLVNDGEFVGLIETAVSPRLREAFSFDFDGAYRLTFSDPRKSITMQNVQSEQVVHVLSSHDRAEPWRGRSSLSWARSAAGLAGGVERMLDESMTSPHGTVMPVGQAAGSKEEQATIKANLASQIRGLKGGILALPVRDLPGKQGAELHALQQWSKTYLGPQVADSLVKLHEQSYNHILSLHGLSPTLFSVDAPPAAIRESLRTTLHTTIEPLARLIEQELSAKLETPVSFSFTSLAGIDVQARSRSVGALVKAGVKLPEALKLVGW